MADTVLMPALESGAIAGLATTVAVGASGLIEQGNAVAPLNAVSHILWGERAAAQDDLTWKYTGSGVGLNVAAVMSWALIHECVAQRMGIARGSRKRLVTGALISALAFVTDYRLVPKRFTPGFEKRLSNAALLGVYTALAIGLASGSSDQCSE